VPETLGDAEVEALARKIKANGRLLAEVFGTHHTPSFPLLRVLFFGSSALNGFSSIWFPNQAWNRALSHQHSPKRGLRKEPIDVRL
jgi:hypothetical protein